MKEPKENFILSVVGRDHVGGDDAKLWHPCRVLMGCGGIKPRVEQALPWAMVLCASGAFRGGQL